MLFVCESVEELTYQINDLKGDTSIQNFPDCPFIKVWDSGGQVVRAYKWPLAKITDKDRIIDDIIRHLSIIIYEYDNAEWEIDYFTYMSPLVLRIFDKMAWRIPDDDRANIKENEKLWEF